MKNLSIGMKIGLGLVLVLIMFITVSIVMIQNTRTLSENTEWVDHTNNVIAEIERVVGNLKDAETGQRGYLITGMDNYLEPFNAALSSLQTNIAELRQLTSDNPNQQRRIEEMKGLVDEKFVELEQTISLRRDIGFEAAREVVVTDAGKKIMDDIRAVLSEMSNEEKELLAARNAKTELASSSAISSIIWLTSIACVVVVFLIFYYTRIIAIPIRKLSGFAEKIASGDFTTQIDKTNRNDELGVLTRAFTIMSENLVTQITEINEGITVLSSSSSEIMAAISQLSSSSAETVTSVSETTSTVAEIKQTAEVTNNKATLVSESAQQNKEVSQKGMKSLEETIEGMSKIKQQMESIAGIVVKLSEQSQSIGEIAVSVNDLAEQSNLLAVNASIEAAKAGEHGKGFAVVAQEIKSLAERSKESTAQIRNILSDIQKAISSAVMATEQGAKAVNDGLELSSVANDVIKSLSISIEEASQASIQIASSSQQQLVGMDQVTAAMESIKEASIQSAGSSKQSEESVTRLHKLGERLKELMSQYKLK